MYANEYGQILNLYESVYTSVNKAVGGKGNDIIRSNSLNDTLLGGDGSNEYWWGSSDGNDIEKDYFIF